MQGFDRRHGRRKGLKRPSMDLIRIKPPFRCKKAKFPPFSSKDTPAALGAAGVSFLFRLPFAVPPAVLRRCAGTAQRKTDRLPAVKRGFSAPALSYRRTLRTVCAKVHLFPDGRGADGFHKLPRFKPFQHSGPGHARIAGVQPQQIPCGQPLVRRHSLQHMIAGQIALPPVCHAVMLRAVVILIDQRAVDRFMRFFVLERLRLGIGQVFFRFFRQNPAVFCQHKNRELGIAVFFWPRKCRRK